jgi:hypothetical protein
MNPDPIEQALSRQPLRPPPARWRAEILATARAAAVGLPNASLSCVDPASAPVPNGAWRTWLREWLWPTPSAWAGLAGVWLVIIVLRVAAPSGALPAALAGIPLPTLASILAAQQQRQSVASILMPAAPGGAERLRGPAVGPRGEVLHLILDA